ncbi:hypothetical protein GDO81_023036 [Engystomops pustulosus]|uniref:Uncharacterized protein n=1 Tax=Engystomops pustulosus TaxID=76066 RepID=A0AAV6Z9T2_ENGPU|nr:hypothetical protein GDO81_023036 [Engystomops pustulosus]
MDLTLLVTDQPKLFTFFTTRVEFLTFSLVLCLFIYNVLLDSRSLARSCNPRVPLSRSFCLVLGLQEICKYLQCLNPDF